MGSGRRSERSPWGRLEVVLGPDHRRLASHTVGDGLVVGAELVFQYW